MSCIGVRNLLDKNKLNCNIPVKDKYKFMFDMFEYQPKNAPYSYHFSDGEKFVVAHGDDDFMIDKIDNDLHMKIIKRVCESNYHNPQKRMDSIMKSLNKLSDKYNIPLKSSREQITEIINKLNEGENKDKILEARDRLLNTINNKELSKNKTINQKGGFLIWLFEKYGIDKIQNSTIRNILWGILEIIDLILLVLQSIPGLQLLAGAGFIIDVIAIVYSFLRLDMFGMVGGIVSIIPLFGDVLGAIIRIIGKVKTYTRRFKSGVRTVKTGVGTAKDIRKDYNQGQLSLTSLSRLSDMSSNVISAVGSKGMKGKKGKGLTKALTYTGTAVDTAMALNEMQQQPMQEQLQQPMQPIQQQMIQ